VEPNPEQKQPEQQPETDDTEVVVPEKEELEKEAAAEEAAEEKAEAKTADQPDAPEGAAKAEGTATAASTESKPVEPEVVDQPAELPEKPLLQAKQSLMYFFWPLILTILYVPAGVIWIAVRYLKYKSQGMVLTNKRLVILKGLFKKKQFMFSLDLAAKAIVTQGFLGKKAGYGTVSVIYQKKEYSFDYVRDPQAFVDACKKAYEDQLASH